MPETSPDQAGNPFEIIDIWWQRISAFGAIMLGTIGEFWLPPPPELVDEAQASGDIWKPFVKFVIVVLLGLMVVPMMRWCCRRRHALKWAKVASVALIAGIIAFFTYNFLLDKWTVSSGGKRYYSGSELREELQVPRLRKMQPRELLAEGEWDPLKIWTERSLRRRYFILSGVYVLCAPIFAIGILATVQTAYCGVRR